MVQVRLTDAFRYVWWARPDTSSASARRSGADLLCHECITFRSETTGALYAWVVLGQIRARRLRRVLEPYAAQAPGYYLYFPSRAQRSAPLRLFIDAAKQFARRTMD